MSDFIGVLGGMGPLATADFLAKLVRNTPARVDQEHIPVLVYGDCTTPDRTASIVGLGPTPLPKLLAGIRLLNEAGVKAICIPCNDVHFWYEDMAAASGAPLFHIAHASAEQARRKRPGAKAVGVLSTVGTHRMCIYCSTLAVLGFEVVAPTEEEFERLVSPAIALVKASQPDDASPLLAEAAAELFGRGAEIIILGCTEIPIGMRRQYKENPELFVDSTEALALAVIDFAKNGAQPTP